MEMWRCLNVEMWMCGDVDVWRCLNVEMCRCGDVDVWRCGCGDV